MKQEVKFLGHVIGYEYIKPDPEKVEALYRYKRPYTITQVQSFLGLAQFYRKFIEHFSKIAAPLYLLTTKEQFELMLGIFLNESTRYDSTELFY